MEFFIFTDLWAREHRPSDCFLLFFTFSIGFWAFVQVSDHPGEVALPFCRSRFFLATLPHRPSVSRTKFTSSFRPVMLMYNIFRVQSLSGAPY
jgi:hypothetical protein